MAENYVSIMQASSLVGVSRRTIYNWLNDGKLRYVRTAGGGIRIVESSLWRKGDAHNPEAVEHPR
jgi:excisionase family DNA binding protein